jgi:transglutaminase-like putative cysteine protease
MQIIQRPVVFSLFFAASLAWGDGITRERFPDADAVVVDETDETSYRPDGTYVSTSSRRIKILTEKGRREEGVLTLHYSARYGSARFIDVRVTGLDGVTRDVDIAATTKESTDNSSMSANIYDPMDRRIVCTVPGLKVGETLIVRSERRTVKPRIAGQWADISVFEWSCPILKSTVRVRSPKELPLKKIVLRNPLGNVTATEKTLDDGSVLRTWTATNSPQVFPEPDMPTLYTQVQNLQLSTADSWQAISKWYWDLCQPHFAKAHGLMTNKVAELTANLPAGDRLARIRAVYKWVAQEIRYMGLTMEETSPGYAPHDVNVTFDNRYGVCRDKAGLLTVMLRLAGIEAYPVLIHAGVKKDPDVPTPYFNHAIVAVANPDGGYQLMDPTDESSRDLMPAYLSNCSYLVARPEGETLRVSPVPPASENALIVDADGTLAADGSVLLEQKISFTGINDNAYRGALLRRRPDERRKFFEGILRNRFGGVELMRCDIRPADLRDTSVPLSVRLVSRVAEAVLRGETREEIDTPFISTAMGVANWLLAGNTALETRRFPLDLSTTACVEETLRLRLSGAGPALTLPPEIRIRGKYAYERDAYLTDGTLVLRRRLAVGATEFAAGEYAALRANVKRVEAAERARPVFGRNHTANANVRYLLRRSDVDFHGTDAWTVTNTTVRQILTYDGKKSSSEMKISYNPTWEKVEIVSAVVSNLDGKVTHVSAKEMNVMDCAWASSAPRYPASKLLVVNLPSVEIGSVISTVVAVTATNAPASFYGRWYFDGYEPTAERTVRVGRQMRTVRDAVPLPVEPMAAPGGLWRDQWTVSSNSFARAAARLRPAVDVAPLEFAEAGSSLASIRDWMAKHVRVTGPSLYEVPLPRQLTAPAVVLKERYATRFDYVRTLCALLRGAGYDADIVFTADDAGETAQSRQDRTVEAPNVRAFATALCRVRERTGWFGWFGGGTRTCYLGTENEYTPLETTPYEGSTLFDPADGSFGVLRPADDVWCASVENVTTLVVRENGGVDFDVDERLRGADVGAFRKRYAEMLPEDRSRHFQSLLGSIAQAASATRELVTETAAYPARRAFSCFVPGYATVADDALTLVLPDFNEALFPLTGVVRETPLGVGARDPEQTLCRVVFPAGWNIVEHLPRPYAFADPRDAREPWYVFSVRTRTDEKGRLVVEVARTRAKRGAAVLPPAYFALLKDWNRIGGSKANRTITVRRGARVR